MMLRVVLCLGSLLVLSFVPATLGDPGGCPEHSVQPGDLLVVRFAPALSPGSADMFDLFVAGDLTDLCGVVVSDGEGTLTFGRLEVRTGDVVRLVSAPDLVIPGDPRIRHTIDWSARDAEVTRSGRFALAKGGDHIAVMSQGASIDTVVYGNEDTDLPGWSGDALEVSRVDRRIYLRGMGPDGYVDTDTAKDWEFPRIYRQHQNDIGADWIVASGEVRVFTCPERCFEEVLLRVDGATERIDLNLYDLSHREATEALAAAASRGVEVRVLLHDRPVAASASKMDRITWAVNELSDHGAEVRTLDRLRYDFNHAKYLIIDGLWTVVLSENANAHGWPPDGANGNRGWGVAVQDRAIADWMTRLFENDHDHPEDSRTLLGSESHPDAQPPSWGWSVGPTTERLPTLVLPSGSGVRVLPVVAPDHLGDPGSSPLVAALQRAETEIWTQQLNLPLDWRRNGHTTASPLTEALLDAGARGVAVRGTLSDAFVDGDVMTPGNDQTAFVLSAAHPAIDLRLGGAPDGQVIHNKGWLIDPVPDGRNLAVVGSANGNLASQTLNREVNLFLEHPEVATYYRMVLETDWLRAHSMHETPPDDPIAALPLPAPSILILVLALASWAGRCRSLDMHSLRGPPRRR